MKEYLDGGGAAMYSSYHDLLAKYKCPQCKRNSVEVIFSRGLGATSFFFCNKVDCARLIATGPSSSIGLSASGSLFGKKGKSADKQIKNIKDQIVQERKRLAELSVKDRTEAENEEQNQIELIIQQLEKTKQDLQNRIIIDKLEKEIEIDQVELLKDKGMEEKAALQEKIRRNESIINKIEDPQNQMNPTSPSERIQEGGGRTVFQSIKESKGKSWFMAMTTAVLANLKCGENGARGNIGYETKRGFFKGMAFYFCTDTMELLSVGPALSILDMGNPLSLPVAYADVNARPLTWSGRGSHEAWAESIGSTGIQTGGKTRKRAKDKRGSFKKRRGSKRKKLRGGSSIKKRKTKKRNKKTRRI